MKKILLLLFTALFAQASIAQLDFTMTGLYSSPLDQFCVDDYQDGWGAKFGLGYTSKYSEKNGVEFGFNWLINNNGYRKTELGIGDYTLRNNWYNWQFKLNHVWDRGVMKYYAGLNAGRASYYTTEYLGFEETQEDDSDYWNDQLYSKSVFQYGAQIGTYIQLNDIISFDLGLSVLRSDQDVKYINFESYTYDGEYIDYQEPTSSPFLVTISAGFRFNLSNIDWSNGSSSTSTSRTHHETYYYSSGSCNRNSSSNSSTNSSSSSSSSKSNSSTPKLYKNGKTPVVYK